MALVPKFRNGVTSSIWTGFVDAMTALLLILMFVLSIFMVVQFVLRETISGQDEELDSLTIQISELSRALGLSQQRETVLEDQMAVLSSTLTAAEELAAQQDALIGALIRESDEKGAAISGLQARVTSFEEQVAGLQARVTSFEEQVASLIAERAELQGRQSQLLAEVAELEVSERAEVSRNEAFRIALAQAREEINAQQEAARLAAARREALEALIAELGREAADTKQTLADTLALLAGAREELGAKDSAIAGLESRVSEGDAALAGAQSALAARETVLADVRTALAAREASLADALALLAGAREELDAKGSTIAGLESRVSEGDAALAARETALADVRTALADREASLAEIRSVLAERESALESAIRRIVQLEAELQSSLALVGRLSAELDAARQERGEAERELAEVRKRTGLASDELRRRIEELSRGLTDAERARIAEAAAAEVLRRRLRESGDELTAMALALEERRRKAEETLALLAAAEAARDAARRDAGRDLTERERLDALLSVARRQVRERETLTEEQQAKIALLNAQMTELREQLGALQGLLDAARAREEAAEVRIATLGSDLNVALAQVAAEQKRRADLEERERRRLEEEAQDLRRFRSEFLAKLESVLAGRAGVRIVGDRFLFSSEILFDVGSADLGDKGKDEIRRVAGIIREVAAEIPEEVDWVLRVDGHTDKTPISGPSAYSDNWELSQARALAVVKHLISDLGIPAGRLAANGFGEHQPISEGDDPASLAQNRRIELKFTER